MSPRRIINHLFNSRTKTVTFAALLIGLSSGLSAVLGIIRDRLLAMTFGAGKELDVYFAAFRIPDFVYGILVVGGLTAAFLPVFSGYFKKEQEEDGLGAPWPTAALNLANNILNCFSALLILLSSTLFVLAPLIINFFVPGFSLEQKTLTVALSRIMFLSPLLLGVSNIFSGILQYFNRFLAYSLAPIFYNLGIIFGIVFFVPLFGLLGLSYGVVFGAVLHLLIQLPSIIGAGYRYRPFLDLKEPGLLTILKLMTPRIIGQASYHLNLIAITAIASTLSGGSIAIFNFANNLQSFPVGLIGISFAIAAFPAFSRSWANQRQEEFLKSFSAVFRQVVFLVFPISILLFVLRAQLVRLVLGAGQFGWLSTRLTAAAVGLFSFGILAAALIPLISRAFFSLKDTKTPVLISLISMALNVILALLFVFLLGCGREHFRALAVNFLKLQGIKNIEVLGLPLALVISQIVQFILLFAFLYSKIKNGNQLEAGYLKKTKAEILSSLKKIILSGFLMTIFIYFSLRIAAPFVDMQTFFGVFCETLIAGIFGVFSYLLFARLFKSPELEIIGSSLIKQFR